ncbi:MAG: type II toxin-antitoxin system RatA family toxin, partial [Nitrosomonadales bacterium]|nr:type II toxin-antitoxin system RatA family toxin [Nitrosomonadales bacterium]
MHNIHKSAIVLHSSKKMFQLVDSVENYPRFLPWCGSTQILERDNSKTIASIEINYKGIRQTFTTENTKKQNKEMMIKLIDGPFQSLSGQWIFKNLDNDSCQIELK